MKNLRSLDEIRAWAESKPPDAIVGFVAQAGMCPLAYCHNELNGTTFEWEFAESIHEYRGVRQSNPAYISFIVAAVDDIRYLSHPVTAAAFLEMLVHVRKRMQHLHGEW